MKLSEMNKNQKEVSRMVRDSIDEYIGGLENSTHDNPIGSESYKNSSSELAEDLDTLCGYALEYFRDMWEWDSCKERRFVGLDFVKARIRTILIHDTWEFKSF